MFDENPVKNNFASVVGQIQDVIRFVDGVLKGMQVSMKGSREGMCDRVENVLLSGVSLWPEIDNVSGNSKAKC